MNLGLDSLFVTSKSVYAVNVFNAQILTFHSRGLFHAAAAEPSPHPHQEERWFLSTGTLFSLIL